MAVISSVITVEWSPASDPFSTSPTWVNITSSVRGVTINRGRGGSLELFGAGKATITLNNRAAAFDPTAWHRWRQIRITATATGPVSNVIFRGFVETIRHDQSHAPRDAVAVIEATDLMGVLSRYEYVASSVPAEVSGVRVSRVLTAIGIPSAWKPVSFGYVDIAALADGTYNGLQHLQDVALAEIGSFYTSAAGVLNFDDRYEPLSRLGAAPVTVFSNTPTGTEVRFLFGDLVLTPPGTEYRNNVTFTGASRIPQTASNVPANYPPDSLSRTVPMSADTQVLSNATLLLEAYRQTTAIWPSGLSVSVWPNSQNAFDEVTALDLNQYCTVKFTPAAKTQQTYKVFVDSITHSIGPSHWSCRIGFSSADRWFNAWGVKTDYLIIGDATYGLIGTAKIGPH